MNERGRTVRRIAAAATVVAMLALAAGCGRDDVDGRRVESAGQGGTDGSTTTSGAAEPAQTSTATETTGDVEVTVAVPDATLPVGERIRITTTVENVGEAPVPWQAGGCANPTAVDLRVAGSSTPMAIEVPMGTDAESTWDGDPATFAAQLTRDEPYGGAPAALSAGPVTGGGDVCTSNFLEKQLAPGATLERDMVLDVRPGPQPLDERGYELVAEFTSLDGREAAVRLPLTIEDDPEREETADLAVAEVPTAPTLDGWIADSKAEVEPRLTQRFTPLLSWWDGRWELWLAPVWGAGNGSVRVRWSPVISDVTEVRSVPNHLLPDDDPDAPDRGNLPPDTIRWSRPME